MDKSIEERAKEYALNYDDKYQVAMFKAYMDGATEQKPKDIDKACKEFCRVCTFYDDCKKHCCPKFIKFKKAMEE